MAYQVGISEQARPVRSFGRRFRGFAHMRDFTQDFPQNFPHADFRRREVLDSPHRLNFGCRLHKMTKVTVASGERACEAVWERAPSRVGSTICIGSSPKGLQKTYHFRFVGEKPGPMSSADCPTRRLRFFRTCFLLNALAIVSIVIFTFFFQAALCAQNSNSSSNSSSTGGPAPIPTPQVSTSQVQTSAQNPVFGSVPEAKPTPGVLSLTFSDAIERALRQNLAGLLSEYNTIEARGEKWQKLSDLLPNVNGTVQEVRQKQSLEALGFTSKIFPSGSSTATFPRVIGPFSY